jgi:hypothetical protein
MEKMEKIEKTDNVEKIEKIEKIEKSGEAEETKEYPIEQILMKMPEEDLFLVKWAHYSVNYSISKLFILIIDQRLHLGGKKKHRRCRGS